MTEAAIASAMAAVLAARSSSPPRVVQGAGVDPEQFACPCAVTLKDRELAKALRGPKPPLFVALAKITPTLLRALREHPPAVVALLGDDDRDALDPSGRAAVLGPNAVVRVGPGNAIACAHRVDELEGLCRALGAQDVRLALSPTPRWLPAALAKAPLKVAPIVGYAPAEVLDRGWVSFARDREAACVLVPVGTPAPPIDRPGDPDLEAVAAAHALERLTGAVFPAPRVLALVLQGLVAGTRRGKAIGTDARRVWEQARRALPMTGAAVGMEAPDRTLRFDSPTAAFLAQRSLLRAQAAARLLESKPPKSPKLEGDGLARAQELLQSAGQVLTDQESKVVLRGFGLDVTRQAVANSASGAVGFADRIGYPVVLKALSPELRRRSDVGGIVLELGNAAAVRRAFATITGNIEERAPTTRLDGVLVAEMLEGGLDIRCGGIRLSSGAVALYGQAQGVSIPIEAALALCPLSPHDALLLAHAVVSRVPVPALRRETDPDLHGLARLLLRLQAVFAHTGERLTSVDLGPVRDVAARGYVTLDARITQRAHLEGD